MQLTNTGKRIVIRFREQQNDGTPKSVSVYRVPVWLVRSMEGLLHTLPGITTIRLTFMSGDNEIGQLSYELSVPSDGDNPAHLENEQGD